MSQLLRFGGLAAAAAMLGACQPSIASISCDEMIERAKQEMADDAVRIASVSNLTEESRSGEEVRCRSDVALSNNETSPLYLRAYREEESGNIMIQWSQEPVEAPVPAQE